jgi:hypothetical protein
VHVALLGSLASIGEEVAMIVRRLAGVLLGLAMLGLAAAPAGAAGDPSALSGPFTGTTSYTFATDGCSFVHQVYEGTFGARGTNGSFRLDGCVDLTTAFGYTGTFTVTARGGQLTGTVTGTIEAQILPCSPFHFTLTVTDGSGRFNRTRGTIAMDGEWCSQGQVPATNDPIDGTVVASLTR